MLRGPFLSNWCEADYRVSRSLTHWRADRLAAGVVRDRIHPTLSRKSRHIRVSAGAESTIGSGNSECKGWKREAA
jgi:hypothetical protein